MTETWSREDIDLLIGCRAWWDDSFDWKAIDALSIAGQWRLVITHADGRQVTIGPHDIAKGRARLFPPRERVAVPSRARTVADLYPRPGKKVESIKNRVRRMQLIAPPPL